MNTCNAMVICLKLTLAHESIWGPRINDIDSNISFWNARGVLETPPRVCLAAAWRCLFNFAKDDIHWAVLTVSSTAPALRREPKEEKGGEEARGERHKRLEANLLALLLPLPSLSYFKGEMPRQALHTLYPPTVNIGTVDSSLRLIIPRPPTPYRT